MPGGGVSHHGLTMVGSGRGGSAVSRTLRFLSHLASRVLPWIFRIGPIGPYFSNLLDLVGPQLHGFLPLLGSLGVNL